MFARVAVLLCSTKGENYRKIRTEKTTLPAHRYTTVFHWKQSLVHDLFAKYEKLISLDRHVRLLIGEVDPQSASGMHALEDEEFIEDLIETGRITPKGLVVTLCLQLGDRNSFGYYPANDQFNLVDVSLDRLSQSILHTFSKEEQEQRVQLAACYRICEMFGWTDTIYGHLTARSAPGRETFLINPFGLLYDEITASSLVRIDLSGNIDHGGVVPEFGINRAGYVIHGAVHEARPDVNCVMHCHFADASAVSCLRDGIASISQTSHILGKVTYHDYEGIAISQDEIRRLQNDLGTESKVLILKNHGVVTCGATIGEAFLLMFTLIEASKIQVRALSAASGSHSADLLRPTEELVRLSMNIAHSINKEGFGQKELSAYMRRLDRTDPSYRR